MQEKTWTVPTEDGGTREMPSSEMRELLKKRPEELTPIELKAREAFYAERKATYIARMRSRSTEELTDISPCWPPMFRPKSEMPEEN